MALVWRWIRCRFILCAAGNGRSSIQGPSSASVKPGADSSTASKQPKFQSSKDGKSKPRAGQNGTSNKAGTQSAKTAPSQATSRPQTKAGNSNGTSSRSPAASSKPAEAMAAIPDKGSDRSIVMPSTAAAQAASGASVINAGSAAATRADRLVSAGTDSLPATACA